MPRTLRRTKVQAVAFRPGSIKDVFAIYLSRELDDAEHVRWYAKLSHQYSLCLLLNVLRRARKSTRGREPVTPEGFQTALGELLAEETWL